MAKECVAGCTIPLRDGCSYSQDSLGAIKEHCVLPLELGYINRKRKLSNFEGTRGHFGCSLHVTTLISNTRDFVFLTISLVALTQGFGSKGIMNWDKRLFL